MRALLFISLMACAPALAQTAFQPAGPGQFQGVPCSILCNKTFWENAGDDVILQIIDDTQAIEAVDETGQTALYYAALYGNADHVARLLEKGADPNSGSSTSVFIPLGVILKRWALDVYYSKPEQADALNGIPYWPDFDPDDTRAKIRLLLAAGSELTGTKSSNDVILESVIMIGEPQVLDFLRDHPDYTELLNRNGFNVMAAALRNGNEDMIAALMADGIELQARSADGDTLLHFLIPKAEVVFQNKLLSSYSKQSPKDWSAPIRYLLENGVNPNATDDAGQTPLMLAAQAGLTDMMMILLDSGANAAIVSADGQTALTMLVRRTDSADPMVTKLIDAGANPSTPLPDGQTLLHLATGFPGQTDLDGLLPYFDDIDVTDGAGRTALFVLVENTRLLNMIGTAFYPEQTDHMRFVQWFIDQGADINAPDAEGATALYRAITSSENPINAIAIKAYLELGAEAIGPGGVICDLSGDLEPTYSRERKGTELIITQDKLQLPCR